MKAELFWTGDTQAVRLPGDCTFAGTEVEVRKVGTTVILEPVAPASAAADEWAWLDAVAGPVPQEFLDALEEDPGVQHRPVLDSL